MGFESNDLEFGPVYLGPGLKKVLNVYESHRKHIKKYIVGFIILFVALLCKFCFENIDNIISSTSAITLEESVYVPFEFSNEVIDKVESKSSTVYPIKHSDVNWKAQIINIADFQKHVQEYLKAADYECIHARHFNVHYDIVVFKNLTVINPSVVLDSPSQYFINEVALDGTLLRVKRPEYIQLRYMDDKLEMHESILYSNQAACFAHYEYTT